MMKSIFSYQIRFDQLTCKIQILGQRILFKDSTWYNNGLIYVTEELDYVNYLKTQCYFREN